MIVLLLANQKGGVGKSALATQLVLHARISLNLRVVAIDFDHQGNLTNALRRNGTFSEEKVSASSLLRAVPCVGSSDAVFVPADTELSALERERELHGAFAGNLIAAVKSFRTQGYDLCVLDVNPNPDIRYGAAMLAASHLLVPIQLNQEAIDGIRGVFDHPRFGYRKVKATLNQDLVFVGMLPNLVEPTPFQKTNFAALVAAYPSALIQLPSVAGGEIARFASIPTRTAIPECQKDGLYMGASRKQSHRDAWRVVEPALRTIFLNLGLTSRAQPALSTDIAK